MRISSSLILISILSLNASCGKWAKAGKESVKTMDRPTYPVVDGDVFALDSEKPATSYKGTIFIANENATAPDFAELINSSVSNREAWAAMKKFEVESDYINLYSNNIGLAPKQVQLMKDGLKAFELEALAKNPIGQAAKLENARTWIERDVATLGLSPTQQASFDASWGEYCEAKVIELATHPILSQRSFKSLPSPAPLCQKYYADRAMFTSADCTTDTGDYLKCIWLDGVIKTRWFTSPLEASNPAVATAKADKRARLTALLSDENYASTKGIFSFNAADFILTNTAFKRLYYDKKEAFINIAIDQKTDANCAKVIVNAASQDLCRVFGLAPEARSPRQIIAAVEDVTANESIFAKLPAPAAPRIATTQQAVRYLQQRYTSETSEADRLFFETRDGSSIEAPTFASAGKTFLDIVPEIRSLLGPEFYGTYSAADNIERASKNAAIAYQTKMITDNRAEWDRLQAIITASTDRGITAGNRPGFGHGLLQYVMLYQQFGNILSAQFSFADYQDFAFRACYDLAASQAVVCPAELPLKAGTTFLEATLKRAPDGGMIEFAFPISQATAIGFGPKARVTEGEKPDFFMDLPTSETEGRTLRFEFYRNRLDGYLDIMTGKAFIEDKGVQYYEAAVSQWEQAD